MEMTQSKFGTVDVLTTCRQHHANAVPTTFTTTPSYAKDDYDEENLVSIGIDSNGADGVDVNAVAAFGSYLKRCIPVKIRDFPSLTTSPSTLSIDVGWSLWQNLCNGDGNPDLLDRPVTVQCQPKKPQPQESKQEGQTPNAAKQIIDSDSLGDHHENHSGTATGTIPTFLGQEDQLSMTLPLREVFQPRDDYWMYVAQESILCVDDNDDTSQRIVCHDDGSLSYQTQSHKTGHSKSTPSWLAPTSDTHSSQCPLADLLPLVRVPSLLFKEVEISQVNLWMAPPCTSMEACQTNLHYDGQDNLLMVLHGTKTIELSPPATFQPSPLHSAHPNHPFKLSRRCSERHGNDQDDKSQRALTLVSPSAPYATIHNTDTNKDKNEKKEEAVISLLDHKSKTRTDETAAKRPFTMIVSVSQGEAIYIPPGWWHRVESTCPSLAINVWFHVHRRDAVTPPPHMMPFKAREAVREYLSLHLMDTAKRVLATERQEALQVALSFDLCMNHCSRQGKRRKTGISPKTSESEHTDPFDFDPCMDHCSRQGKGRKRGISPKASENEHANLTETTARLHTVDGILEALARCLGQEELRVVKPSAGEASVTTTSTRKRQEQEREDWAVTQMSRLINLLLLTADMDHSSQRLSVLQFLGRELAANGLSPVLATTRGNIEDDDDDSNNNVNDTSRTCKGTSPLACSTISTILLNLQPGPCFVLSELLEKQAAEEGGESVDGMDAAHCCFHQLSLVVAEAECEKQGTKDGEQAVPTPTNDGSYNHFRRFLESQVATFKAKISRHLLLDELKLL